LCFWHAVLRSRGGGQHGDEQQGWRYAHRPQSTH
jgi:hypothetical protein